ncbi:unnamed protein product [Peniophora sp. CBMAI 1063]|nr:unnamed protein product [Peniophora sp. CBMAI 1063]
MPKVASAKSSGSGSGSGSGTGSASGLKRNQACHTCRKRKLKCDAKKPCATCIRSYQYAKTHPQPGVVPPETIDCTYDEVPGLPEIPRDRYEQLEDRIRELEGLLRGQSSGIQQPIAMNDVSRVLSVIMSSPPETSGTMAPPPFTSLSNTTMVDNGLDLLSALASGTMPSGMTTYPSSSPGMSPLFPPTPSGGQSQHSSSGLSPPSASPPGAGSDGPGRSPSASAPSPRNNVDPFMVGFGSGAGCWEERPPAQPTPAPARDQGAKSTPNSVDLMDAALGTPYYPDNQQNLVYTGWPEDLPAPELLKHLVESFFAFHPHANRLFHQPTFMNDLCLPPTHPSFPTTSVLHALCAVGSQYTAVISQTEPPGGGVMPPSEAFQNKWKQPDHTDSFAETHIKLSRRHTEQDTLHGRRMIDNMQSMLLCVFWYWSNGKWVEVFLVTSQITRSCGPLGLSMNLDFTPISTAAVGLSLIPEPRDAIEEETRRNIFWLSYMLDRLSQSGNLWPHALHEEDCTQVFPVNALNFTLGESYPPAKERESLLQDDIILRHSPDTCDSFNLYLKGVTLVGRVKDFNIHFRREKFKAAGSHQYSSMWRRVWEAECPISEDYDYKNDPRCTGAFIELHQATLEFRHTFPPHLRDPFALGSIDSYLYAACLLPHLANINLHDPHAHLENRTCQSAANLLRSARAILELLYSAQSTSFDLSLLDPICNLAWFVAGKTLLRFWQVALQVDAQEQVQTFKTEVEFIASALGQIGQRIFLAKGYCLLLSSIANKMCGASLY